MFSLVIVTEWVLEFIFFLLIFPSSFPDPIRGRNTVVVDLSYFSFKIFKYNQVLYDVLVLYFLEKSKKKRLVRILAIIKPILHKIYVGINMRGGCTLHITIFSPPQSLENTRRDQALEIILIWPLWCLGVFTNRAARTSLVNIELELSRVN